MYKSARHRKKKLMAEINVVPYIDVMLVLLVIFMVTAPLLTEGVKVDLVQADARQIENTEQEPVVLTVDKDGTYFIDKEAKEPTPSGPTPPRCCGATPRWSFCFAGIRKWLTRRLSTPWCCCNRAAYPV